MPSFVPPQIILPAGENRFKHVREWNLPWSLQKASLHGSNSEQQLPRYLHRCASSCHYPVPSPANTKHEPRARAHILRTSLLSLPHRSSHRAVYHSFYLDPRFSIRTSPHPRGPSLSFMLRLVTCAQTIGHSKSSGAIASERSVGEYLALFTSSRPVGQRPPPECHGGSPTAVPHRGCLEAASPLACGSCTLPP